MYGGRWFFRFERNQRNDPENERNARRSADGIEEKVDFHKIIWDEYLPSALVYGVSYDVFWHLNPRKLEPFKKAYSIKQEERDAEIWAICGNYVRSAVFNAVESCLNGKKSSSKYIEKPILHDKIKNEGELTEEELQKQRELFVAKLLVMKTNFELHNNSKNDN